MAIALTSALLASLEAVSVVTVSVAGLKLFSALISALVDSKLTSALLAFLDARSVVTSAVKLLVAYSQTC